MSGTVTRAAFSMLARASRTLHGRADELRSLKQFVLLQYAPALGSVVHATPLISALRTAVPDARIIVCASGFAREIYRGNPAVDKLVETPSPTEHLLSAAAAIRQGLPRGRFATLTTVSNERVAVGLAAVLAGARNLVGFTLGQELYRTALPYDAGMSQIGNNLRIVQALGHFVEEPLPPFEPQVFFSVDDLEYANSLLRRFDKAKRPAAVLVTQTSVTQRKSWRPERFVAVAAALRERYGMNVLLVGAGSERESVARLVQQIGAGVQSVAGETSLPQLAALLSLCRVGVTLDTGTMHLGRAVGLKMVVIAPAWSPPLEWLPLNDPRFIILKHADMLPQQMPADYIIDEVSVDDVLKSLATLLGRPAEGMAR